MAITLSQLPNEIVYQILLCVPPTSVPKVQQVSKQFNDLAQPLLWQYHCLTQFEYWDPERRIEEKRAAAPIETDWKKIFSERHIIDRDTVKLINGILSTQAGRIAKGEKINLHGYDAKDTLLRQIRCADSAPDVLARRYYSDTVLGNLHRDMAIREWVKLRDGESNSLERALVAFDMFVLHERKGDFDEVSTILDRIAEQFCMEEADFPAGSLRQKATALVRFLRRQNFVGINGDATYHDLQNNFIGIALQHESHPSLPLVSVVIFCCVAQRLGIDAHPCGFPFHVLAVIIPPQGRTFEGVAHDEDHSISMYLDPFRSNEEVPVQDLVAQLRSLGVPSSRFAEFMGASTIKEIVRRCAKNIITSVHALPRHNGAAPMSTVESSPEMDGALYAALWSLIILPEEDEDNNQRSRYLQFLVEKLEKQYLMDVGLIEEHVVPTLRDAAQRESLMKMMEVTRSGDNMSKPVHPREAETRTKVQYKVGQLFHHRRYHYQGVITGWDAECAASEDWIAHMGVHTLSRGQHQSFYHVLVEDKSVRYVAEENIQVQSEDVKDPLMALAGQHFKRWDGTIRMFVSNIRDEYPDD